MSSWPHGVQVKADELSDQIRLVSDTEVACLVSLINDHAVSRMWHDLLTNEIARVD